MARKGKRASSDSSAEADTSRRRSAVPVETLRKMRVAGPAVLPPPRSDAKGKRVELDLVSKRVYQETILRCEVVQSSTILRR